MASTMPFSTANEIPGNVHSGQRLLKFKPLSPVQGRDIEVYLGELAPAATLLFMSVDDPLPIVLDRLPIGDLGGLEVDVNAEFPL